jgi:site-specific recombinase XerD
VRRNRRFPATKSRPPKIKLGLPDLDQSRSAVLSSLRSPESQRGYRHSIDEFIAWYCSEPRPSFSKTVVTRYRIHLEGRQLAPGTINVRLAAVRRLAYEAADSGLLSPELAAGIRRVKGAQKLGVRLGNWLTAEEARRLWQAPEIDTLKGKRDRSLLAILLGCGLWHRKLAELTVDLLQRREGCWALVDSVEKGDTSKRNNPRFNVPLVAYRTHTCVPRANMRRRSAVSQLLQRVNCLLS